MDINPKKENVDLIDRKPLAYTLAVFVVLLSVFITRLFLTDNKSSDDCAKQRQSAEYRAAKSDSIAKAAGDELVRYLLTEKERRERQKEQADSVVRKVLGSH